MVCVLIMAHAAACGLLMMIYDGRIGGMPVVARLVVWRSDNRSRHVSKMTAALIHDSSFGIFKK